MEEPGQLVWTLQPASSDEWRLITGDHPKWGSCVYRVSRESIDMVFGELGWPFPPDWLITEALKGIG